MNFRKFIAILTAIAAFPAAGSLVVMAAINFLGIGPPFTIPLFWFTGFIAASFVYNLIKGEEPEVKEKQGITSKEISEKLEEMRNKGN
jgi:cytosine/uracil/thiamine/allantoin permease